MSRYFVDAKLLLLEAIFNDGPQEGYVEVVPLTEVSALRARVAELERESASLRSRLDLLSFDEHVAEHTGQLRAELKRACRFFQLLYHSAYTVGIVPPSITYSVPVIDAARGDARKAMRFATSTGFDGRPSGMPPSESMMICVPPS